MFNTRVIFLFLLYVAISIAACSKPDNDPIIILSVDKEFSLDLWENLQPDAAALEIHLESILDQDCLNKTIRTSYDRIGNNLTITIFDITDPETCDPGNAPAVGFEYINNIGEGTYNLMIELQEVVSNTGKLIVTENDFKIEMNYETGIKWQHKVLSKVAESTLWGYITYQGGSQSSIAADLINTLQDSGTVFDRTDGYFGHFTIENSEVIAVNKSPLDSEAKLFIQYYEGSLDALNVIVDDFRATMPQEMELHLFDGKGNEW